jgi:hypothetical protein
MNSYIILQDGVSMSIDMKPYNVDRSHPNYDKIVDALKSNDWISVEELVNIAKSIVKFCGDKLSVDTDNGIVSYAGEQLHNSLTDRILTMMREGFDITPLVNFLENLMQNPSKRAVDELYGFLEHGKMPITPDGHFLAYKRVRDDYKSVHDGKTDNSVGNVVEMPRNKVDDNKDVTCSYGLHFCSHGYLKSFSGAKVVVLKVNPRDVVSIPTDYNNTKGRACRYEVVGELTSEQVDLALSNGVWNESVVEDYDNEDADRELGEAVSQSYLDGYERGRKEGRDGTPQGSAVVVMGYVDNTEEYIEGFYRGYADGKGHKAKADLYVADEDNSDFDAPTDEDTWN